MFRRVPVAALGLALALTGVVPASAEPVYKPEVSGNSRFRHLDVAKLGKIANLPQSLQQDKVVSALVQLSGEPVAVQRAQRPRTFTRRGAEARVRSDQDRAVPQLKQAGAEPYGRLSTVLNAVQVRVKVRDLPKVAAVPGVKKVQVSQVVHANNAAAERFTGVDRTWQDLKRTGKGQVIGVIDTGIDYTHADFGGAGTEAAYEDNDGTIVERGSFPTAKVTGGYDFVGDEYDASSDDPAALTPQPDPDPLDCEGHGSHVAGTAAGYGVTADGKTYRGPYSVAGLKKNFDVAPGTAPQATLKAYRVFGCEGSAFDDVIVAAIDRAVSDGVDIINMSLGGPFGTADNLDDLAIRTATSAGVLVVTSGGNEGPNAYMAGAPGTSDTALAVAAVDAEYKTFPGVSITGAATATAIDANGAPIPSPITAELVDVGLGCDITDYAHVRGKIALATRGDCDRVFRAQFGESAGAKAVIMINNAAGLPPFEGDIEGVSIPFIGADGNDSDELLAAAGQRVTIAKGRDLANPAYAAAADFTSNGPRRGDSAQKPDLAAPGVSIPSVAVGTGTGSTRISGTSMAAPHVAGVAALVGQAHPTWTSAQLKAALMSTANPAKLRAFDSRRLGSGLVQPRRATATKAYLYTDSHLNSLRFGKNQLNGAYHETQSFKIVNHSRKSTTYRFSSAISGKRYGASVSFSPRTVALKAGQTRTVKVRISLSRSDVAKLPGAHRNLDGALVTLNGLVIATPTKSSEATPTLQMSFLFVPLPLSDIRSSATVTQTGSDSFSPITVRNRGVHTGSADVYSWLLADPAGDGFDDEVADLTNVGVQSLPGSVVKANPSDRLLVFAASEAASTSTHATRDVEIAIDVDGDTFADYVTFATDSGYILTGSYDGTVTAFTLRLSDNTLVDAWTATAPANGSTVELAVLASQIGVDSTTGPLGVEAAGFSLITSAPGDQVAGRATFDAFHPALSQGDNVDVKPGRSARIAVDVDTSRFADQTHAGWLVVSLDDRAGLWETDRVKLKVTGAVPAAKQAGR